MEEAQKNDATPERRIDSRTAAREGTRILLLAFVVGIVTGAATWLFLTVDHLGVKFLWETLPEHFSSLPAWVVPVGVVVIMTAIAALIVFACKRRPFDSGGAEHE